jgi:hypothetical protein
MGILMAKFIPTHHKKFIVLISYSYKFQASRPGVFLTNFVNFIADKCQNDRLKGEIFTTEGTEMESSKGSADYAD